MKDSLEDPARPAVETNRRWLWRRLRIQWQKAGGGADARERCFEECVANVVKSGDEV